MKQHIVFRAAGTVDKSLLEQGYSAFEEIFLTQIDTYLGLDKNGFRVVYAEYDGTVTTAPAPEEPVAPRYTGGTSFWSYSSNRTFWDSYWDAYILSDAIEGGCILLDGCDGCELPEFDGCNLEGCTLDGCGSDGCDGGGCDGGGCDSSGCDSGGCDMSASLGMISTFTRDILKHS